MEPHIEGGKRKIENKQRNWNRTDTVSQRTLVTEDACGWGENVLMVFLIYD